jgi:predicted metal-dependent phosphoesterase TrpH
MLIDLHVHTRWTPGGTLRPLDVLARARARGLDGVAFTDLDTLASLPEVRAAASETGVLALLGLTLATDQGRFLCFFAAPERLAPVTELFGGAPRPVRAALARVVALGGLAVAAHPYEKTLAPACADALFTLDGIAAIEGLHGRSRAAVNDLAVEAADHLGLPCVGGSGALGSLEELGAAATLFREPVADEAGLVAQLRAGACWAAGLRSAAPSAPSAAASRPGTRRDASPPARSTPPSRPAGRS